MKKEISYSEFIDSMDEIFKTYSLEDLKDMENYILHDINATPSKFNTFSSEKTALLQHRLEVVRKLIEEKKV